MRRKAAVQLALHSSVIAKLKADPFVPYVEIAERNIGSMRSAVRGPSMGRSLDRWAELISGPFDRMESSSLADDEPGRELRALNPFTAVLTQEERIEAIQSVVRQPEECG
ncbi:hypothetical protein BKP42_18490 [Rhodococcus erythropolis]|uniref:hypothetical protein n=1 Tax=Rhodococcus erythropolis TaxID=1833 RepID=UPI000BB2E8DB|nr:hypothetical protein [Rhodococcus erythropolis]PBI99186.1 hypothetical protein BKP42_18490 [Rhodococcus erythropolis]